MQRANSNGVCGPVYLRHTFASTHMLSALAVPEPLLLVMLCAQGKRYSLPNSRIMIHQPLGGAQGQAAGESLLLSILSYLLWHGSGHVLLVLAVAVIVALQTTAASAGMPLQPGL